MTKICNNYDCLRQGLITIISENRGSLSVEEVYYLEKCISILLKLEKPTEGVNNTILIEDLLIMWIRVFANTDLQEKLQEIFDSYL